MLIKLEAEFWQHVKNDTPPPVDWSKACTEFLAERFAECKKAQINLPSEAEKLIEQYSEACDKLTILTEQKQLAENKLKEMLGENETGIVGANIVSWKGVSQERLDSKTFKAEHPTLYKKYANKTSQRRFSIKTNN